MRLDNIISIPIDAIERKLRRHSPQHAGVVVVICLRSSAGVPQKSKSPHGPVNVIEKDTSRSCECRLTSVEALEKVEMQKQHRKP